MPVTPHENLFGALFKWGDAKSKEEDFYSKSLILILQRLRRDRTALVTNFLNSLFGNTVFRLDNDEDYKIRDHTGEENMICRT